MSSILTALRALLFALALVPLLMISGCGLKGDLVLPEPGDSPSARQESDEEDDDSNTPDGSRA